MSKPKKADKIRRDVMLLGGIEVDDARVHLNLVVRWKEGMFMMDVGLQDLSDADGTLDWIKRRLPEWKATFRKYEEERQDDASHKTS